MDQNQRPDSAVCLHQVRIIGLGAIGAVYAAKLQGILGDDFGAIAGGARAQRLLQEGLLINGQRCDFHLLDPAQPQQPADLVILTVKYTQLEQAIEDIRPFIGRDTMILSLLNGISSEPRLAQAFGHRHLIYGKAFMDAQKAGNTIVCGGMGVIPLGEWDGQVTPRVQAVAGLFEKAGIPCGISRNIRRDLWHKLMVNVGENQISALTGATYGDCMRIPAARGAIRQAMMEVIALSQAAGTGLTVQDYERWEQKILRSTTEGKTSMLQDIEAGRKTEAALFAQTIVALGQQYGIPTPVNTFLLDAVRAKEAISIARGGCAHRPA